MAEFWGMREACSGTIQIKKSSNTELVVLVNLSGSLQGLIIELRRKSIAEDSKSKMCGSVTSFY